MLNEITIKNINAIKDAHIVFRKQGYQYLQGAVSPDGVLTAVGIYGHNGSGKTAIISAFNQLVSLLVDPLSDLRPFIINQMVLDEEFEAMKKEKRKVKIEALTASFSLSFTSKGKEFTYLIETSPWQIEHETLCQNGELIFERNKLLSSFGGNKYEEQKYLPSLRRLASDFPTSEAISVCFDYLSNVACLFCPTTNYKIKAFKSKSPEDIMVEKSSEVREILKKYKDFPVYMLERREQEGKDIKNQETPKYFVRIEGSTKKIRIPVAWISSGMLSQSFLLSAALSLPENGLMVIDEIEAALHPATVLDFLKVMQEKGIQVLFTSHNTNIMQSLRPDQIYFSSWDDGFSYYSRLSELYPNIREINNIEKMYLSGFFDRYINESK